MSTDAKSEIQTVMQRWVDAAIAADRDGLRNLYADDIVSFDAVMQLQFKGRDAYMKHWDACFEMCPGQHVFTLAETDIEADGDLGFSRTLLKCGAIDENGTEQSSWMRTTACYRKIGGDWKIVHEHFSVPFDMESGKAIFDATP